MLRVSQKLDQLFPFDGVIDRTMPVLNLEAIKALPHVGVCCGNEAKRARSEPYKPRSMQSPEFFGMFSLTVRVASLRALVESWHLKRFGECHDPTIHNTVGV